MTTTRQLYLDLLIKILANTIYEDPSINPANTGPFQPELRATGLDWPAVAHTMVGVRRLENVRDLAQRALDEQIPGDFIETGIWRGGCCILMRGVLAANGIKDRKVYAADSFAGLPPPDPHAYPADDGFNFHLHEELAVSLDTVKDNFARYGLLDAQVVFVPGYFEDTLASLNAGPFCLIRLDGDYYKSTYIALEALSEIDSKTSHDYTIYRIGITENPTERKEEWSAKETTKYWKQWQADSSTDAKAIENYFINEKKMKGGTGGDISAKTTWVYVF